MRTSLANKIVFIFLLLMLITFLSSIFVILYQLRNIDLSAEVSGALENILYGGIAIVTAIVLFTIILGRILVYAISRPLEKLISETENIAKGNYTSEVRVSTNDEIETLADSINTMATTIRAYTGQLKAQRDTLQGVFDSISGSLLIIEEDYSIVMYNEKTGCFYQGAGTGRKELLARAKSPGGTCYEVFYGREAPCDGCIVRKTLESEKSLFSEITFHSEVYDFNTSIMPQSGGPDHKQRVIIHSTKVTEQVLMEKEVMQMDKLAQMGQLAAGITHELKNPMSTIKAGLYYLEQLRISDIPQYIHDAETRETLSSMKESLQRAEASVYNILEFSRPNDLKKEPILLDRILRQVLLLFSKELIKCKTKVILDVKENELIGSYDSNMIKNVFIHLIANAIQAMPGGGEIRIKKQETGGKEIRISVSDTGPGIDKQQADKIFEPFYTTKEDEGTGLGLWIVKKQLERVGASIEVDRDAGTGATFLITLPEKTEDER